MKKFKAGAPVWWLRTRGGGGGSGKRKNEKEQVAATFLRYGSGSKVEIQVDPPGRDKPFWVALANILPASKHRSSPEELKELERTYDDETERLADMDGMQPGVGEDTELYHFDGATDEAGESDVAEKIGNLLDNHLQNKNMLFMWDRAGTRYMVNVSVSLVESEA